MWYYKNKLLPIILANSKYIHMLNNQMFTFVRHENV